MGKGYYLTWFLDITLGNQRRTLPVLPVQVYVRISGALCLCLSIDRDDDSERSTAWSVDIPVEILERPNQSLYPSNLFARIAGELKGDFFELLGLCTAEAVILEEGKIEYRLNTSLLVYDAKEGDFAFATFLFENQISFEHYIFGTYSSLPLVIRRQIFVEGEEDSEETL